MEQGIGGWEIGNILDRKRFEAIVVSDRRGGEKESRRPGFAYGSASGIQQSDMKL